MVGSGLVGLLGLGGKEATSECSEDGSLSEPSDGGCTGEGLFLTSLRTGVSGGRSSGSTEDLDL